MTSSIGGQVPLATPDGNLEIIDKGAISDAHPVPLLFVHGGVHAAWCWDEHFLDFFATRGFRAAAVSLRGHGASPTPRPLSKVSIIDYVDDIRLAAEYLGTAPVLIGHSLGGFVVQKYLESHRVPAAVLLASAPPHGLGRFFFRIVLRCARKQPALMVKCVLSGDSVPMIATPMLARDAFFSAAVGDADVARWASQFQDESLRAIFDTMLVHRVKPQRLSTSVLVLGADLDGSISTKEVHATARAYGTEAEIVPDMGHDMMLEPGWLSVAERILCWLTAKGI